MRIAALLSLPVLLLAACSPSPGDPEAPPIDVSPATLAGVDLGRPIRALGNEPFWTLTGCAASVSALATAGESGLVIDKG